jgi:hypothetical protein
MPRVLFTRNQKAIVIRTRDGCKCVAYQSLADAMIAYRVARGLFRFTRRWLAEQVLSRTLPAERKTMFKRRADGGDIAWDDRADVQLNDLAELSTTIK